MSSQKTEAFKTITNNQTYPKMSILPRVFPIKPPVMQSKEPSASTPGGENSTFALQPPSLCAPFPACDPAGCGDGVAPIDCPGCNRPVTYLVLVVFCLLAVVIVVANVLVVLVIGRTRDLRRRHGYIKISLAVSDLLMGAVVLPVAIGNMTSALFEARTPEGTTLDALQQLVQVNTGASVAVGTVLVVSVTSSIYNMLLLSLDRCLAVVFPLQSNSGRFFSKFKVYIAIACVWTFALALSTIPALRQDKFTYAMDPNTFFYMQMATSHVNDTPASSSNVTAVASSSTADVTEPMALFALFVIGIPYLAVVVVNVLTLSVVRTKLRARKNMSARRKDRYKKPKRNSEQEMRMKMMLENYPEMEYEESRARSWLRKLKYPRNKNANNVAKPRDRSSTSGGESSAIIRGAGREEQKSQRASGAKSRVMKMILTMIIVFTLCVLPYVVVAGLMYDQTLNCDNAAVPYLLATYLVVFNSACNFFIYNGWHTEFRIQLYNWLTCAIRRQKYLRQTITNSSDRLRPAPVVLRTRTTTFTASGTPGTAAAARNSRTDEIDS